MKVKVKTPFYTAGEAGVSRGNFELRNLLVVARIVAIVPESTSKLRQRFKLIAVLMFVILGAVWESGICSSPLSGRGGLPLRSTRTVRAD
jgi:hypothetical protein